MFNDRMRTKGAINSVNMITDFRYNFQLPVLATLLSLKYWFTLLLRVWKNSCDSFREKRGISLLVIFNCCWLGKIIEF